MIRQRPPKRLNQPCALHTLADYNGGCRCRVCVRLRKVYAQAYNEKRKDPAYVPRAYTRKTPVSDETDTLSYDTVESKGLTPEAAWASHKW